MFSNDIYQSKMSSARKRKESQPVSWAHEDNSRELKKKLTPTLKLSQRNTNLLSDKLITDFNAMKRVSGQNLV